MLKHSITFITLLYLLNYANTLESGDECEDKNGIPGVCKLLLYCESALESIKYGRIPHTCGFEDNIKPLVCCTDRKKTEKPIVTGTRSNLRKSDLKCKEYAKSVFQNISVPVLMIGFNKTVRIDVCGHTVSELIVGGQKTKAKEFPHMALLGYDNEGNITYSCGGSLISERFVLTAGHCLFSREYGEVKYVRLGEHNLNHTGETTTQDFKIIEKIKHPNYSPPSQYNDLALLKLDRDAEFDAFVRPICLNTEESPKQNKYLATGWGLTDYYDDKGTDTLMKVTLSLFTTNECTEKYSKNNRQLKNGIDEITQICAGSKTESKDTCQGDSGGPLQNFHPTEYCMYSQIGVTSFGKACGIVNVPGVYTRVYNYLDWIESIVWPDE